MGRAQATLEIKYFFFFMEEETDDLLPFISFVLLCAIKLHNMRCNSCKRWKSNIFVEKYVKIFTQQFD